MNIVAQEVTVKPVENGFLLTTELDNERKFFVFHNWKDVLEYFKTNEPKFVVSAYEQTYTEIE